MTLGLWIPDRTGMTIKRYGVVVAIVKIHDRFFAPTL